MTIRSLRNSATCLIVLLALGLAGRPAHSAGKNETQVTEGQNETTNLADALRDGEFHVHLRYRYETVSEDAFDSDAEASTLRTTLSYATAWFHGFRGFLEFEDVANLGLGSKHNSLTNGVTDRPVIADPRTTEVHQVMLGYGGDETTHVRFGRQEIILDDQRFVGNVGWRQNRQSFDAVKIGYRSVPRLHLTYAYVGNVNDVIGRNRMTNSHLLDARVDLRRLGSVGAYYYYIDFDSDLFAPLSSGTFGAAWTGEARAGDLTVPFRVELARQNDAGDNPGTIDAGYLRAEVGLSWEKITANLGHEVLEGKADDGQFNTPFATLHKFNGWADKFPLTPTNGLQDSYLAFGYRGLAWQATVIFHWFGADSGGADYGDEIDGVVTYTAPWDQSFSFSFARYNADEFSTDTNKVWLYTTYRF